MPSHQYFLSYSRTDAETALKLAHDLKAANVRVWIDQLDIKAGSLWDESIEQALEKCTGLLFIASKVSVASPNAMNEVHFAIREKKSVIPVRIDDCKIPLLLIRYNYIDLAENYDRGLLQLVNRLTNSDAALPLSSIGDQSSGVENKSNRDQTGERPLVQKAKNTTMPKGRLLALVGGVVITAVALILLFGGNNAGSVNESQNESATLGMQTEDSTAITGAATADSLYEAGMEYYEQKNFTDAFNHLQEAAQNGNISAMFETGNLYANGEGVNRDHPTAITWYAKAAEKGHIIAMYSLADLYENGVGVTRDFSKAMLWYTKSAEGGYKYAFTNVGDLYFEGKGVGVDYKKAVEWYQKAADAGEANGTHSLAYMYENGYGVNADKTKAEELYKKAKDLGYQDAEETAGQ